MKILFLATKDSGNYSMVNVIQEFIKRGHEVKVVSFFKEYLHTKIFISKNIDFVYVSDFDFNDACNYEVVFFTQYIVEAGEKAEQILKIIKNQKIMTFTLNNLQFGYNVHPSSRFVFCIGENRVEEIFQNGQRYNCIAIGNPQYDDLFMLSKNKKNDKETILFIDCGAFPVGEIARRELVKVLFNVAKKNPDKYLVVKPRYLLNENKNQTHKSLDHLYNYIYENDNIPSNIVLLNEYTNLEEIIFNSDYILTIFSTAYIEGMLLNKPSILIEGLPTVEIYELSNNRLDLIFDKLRKTGCVENYKLLENCNVKFNICDKKYLDKEVYDYKNKSSEKILEFMEYAYDQFKNNYDDIPLFSKMNYGNYKIILSSSKCLNGDISRNRYEIINFFIQYLIDKNSGVYNCNIPKQEITSLWNYVNQEDKMSLDDFNKFIYNKVKKIEEYYENLILSKDNLSRIEQEVYLKNLYNEKQYEQIINRNSKIEYHEAYVFYNAMVMFEIKDYYSALRGFEEYIELENDKNYNEFVIDTDEYKNLVITHIFICDLKLKDLKSFYHKLGTVSKDVANKLLQVLYNEGEYKFIVNLEDSYFDKPQIKFYKGKSYYMIQDYNSCIAQLSEYFNIKEETKVFNYIYNENFILSVCFYMGIAFYNLNIYDEAILYFQKCNLLTNNNHIKATEYLDLCKQRRGK